MPRGTGWERLPRVPRRHWRREIEAASRRVRSDAGLRGRMITRWCDRLAAEETVVSQYRALAQFSG